MGKRERYQMATMPDAADVEKRLKSIIDYVQDCERRVMKGEVMDLSGLDDKVVEICDTVTSMPPKQAHALEPMMGKLIEKLEVLAAAMRAQQSRLTVVED